MKLCKKPQTYDETGGGSRVERIIVAGITIPSFVTADIVGRAVGGITQEAISIALALRVSALE